MHHLLRKRSSSILYILLLILPLVLGAIRTMYKLSLKCIKHLLLNQLALKKDMVRYFLLLFALLLALTMPAQCQGFDDPSLRSTGLPKNSQVTPAYAIFPAPVRTRTCPPDQLYDPRTLRCRTVIGENYWWKYMLLCKSLYQELFRYHNYELCNINRIKRKPIEFCQFAYLTYHLFVIISEDAYFK